jgi:hypothetical protein
VVECIFGVREDACVADFAHEEVRVDLVVSCGDTQISAHPRLKAPPIAAGALYRLVLLTVEHELGDKVSTVRARRQRVETIKSPARLPYNVLQGSICAAMCRALRCCQARPFSSWHDALLSMVSTVPTVRWSAAVFRAPGSIQLVVFLSVYVWVVDLLAVSDLQTLIDWARRIRGITVGHERRGRGVQSGLI